jgi:hypothetical protein
VVRGERLSEAKVFRGTRRLEVRLGVRARPAVAERASKIT